MLLTANLFLLVYREIRVKACDNSIACLAVDPIASLTLPLVLKVVEAKAIPLFILDHAILYAIVVQMNAKPFWFIVVQPADVVDFAVGDTRPEDFKPVCGVVELPLHARGFVPDLSGQDHFFCRHMVVVLHLLEYRIHHWHFVLFKSEPVNAQLVCE